ncbi:MAG: transporter ATP-binding protein, partial [Frankiales bacterium]|nr:transporter ATP-binding protein [Frankiales bacterium]
APAVVADLFALVGDLKSRGIAVVMVEQFVGQALKVADRAIVLEQGSVVAAGAPDELSQDDLAAAYLGGGDAPALDLRPAPDGARERQGLSLRGADMRRLSALAEERGQSVEQVLEELVGDVLTPAAPARRRAR